MNRRSSEKGQIIVILALGMVAILAITALAVDGSLLYNQRRNDQNTADSAAMAGAGAAAHKLKDYLPTDFSCGPGSTSLARQASDVAVAAAVLSALDDGVNLDQYDLTNKNGVTVRCQADSEGMQFLDIHVMVTSEPETTFGRVISVDTLRTTTEAIARVYPNQPFAYGNALVSLADDCGKNVGGIWFNGNSTSFINRGGIFSNSCVDAGGSSIVDVVGGSVNAFLPTGCDGYAPTHTVTPAVPCTKAASKLPKGMIPPPVCPDRSIPGIVHTTGSFSGNHTGINALTPGWYDSGMTIKNGANVELSPGLYCIKGGMTNHAKSRIFGEDVTLYFQDDSAVKFNQNDASIGYGTELYAPSCNTSACGVPDAVQGLLMFFKTGINNQFNAQVQLNGGSHNKYVGTIYGENADFTFNGGAEIYTFNTQVIGRYIFVSGNAELMMDLNSKQWVQRPASISLIK